MEVAVDDEREVVELFARGERQRAQRFRLVALAVAHHDPDSLLAGVFDAAVMQVVVEARLVDAHQRRQPHRDCGEFPEIRHEPGVRVRTEAARRAQFAPEVFQLLFGEASFQKSAGVEAGRSMALKINLVAAEVLAFGPEEVVKPHFKKRGG